MCLPKLHAPLRIVGFLLPIVPCLFWPPPPALGQESASEGSVLRGDKAEISVTVRDSAGEPISAPASESLQARDANRSQGGVTRTRVLHSAKSRGLYRGRGCDRLQERPKGSVGTRQREGRSRRLSAKRIG